MKDWVDSVDKAAGDALTWVVVTVLGGIFAGFSWIIRRVFTNQKQIEMLQVEIKARDEMRGRDRADMKEVKEDVKALNRHILTLGTHKE